MYVYVFKFFFKLGNIDSVVENKYRVYVVVFFLISLLIVDNVWLRLKNEDICFVYKSIWK